MTGAVTLKLGDKVRRLACSTQTGTVVGVMPDQNGRPFYTVDLRDPTETVERPAGCFELLERPADLTNDAPRRCSYRTLDGDGSIRQCVHQQGHSCKCEPTPRGKTDGECRECGHEYGLHFGYCDQYTEHCPDAPRRRTEPAITVPPVYRWEDVRIGDVICDDEPESDGNMRVTRIVNDCVTVEVLRRPGVEQRWHRSLWEKASCVTLVARQHDPRPLWLPHQVESILQHGSAAYACMAADCDQVRELLAVEEAKAEMEAWRLSNADWLDHYCDSDATGDLARQGIEYREQFVARWESWLAALTPPAEGATLGDWAAAQPDPPMKWSREYMQHLYDKLAKGEVVGGV